MDRRTTRLPPGVPGATIGCIDHGRTGDADGYLNTRGNVAGQLRRYRLHRRVCAEANGLSLDAIVGQVVRHTCDNPRCINPEHLLLGTPAQNSTDMVGRGRSLRGQNHPRSRISDADAQLVRARFIPGTGKGSRCSNAAALAREFGISATMVRKIGHGGRCSA